MFILTISCLNVSNLPWFIPDIPGSYAKLFFAASDFIFIPWHIHNWASLPLRPSRFIPSGVISRSPLFPCSILDTFQPGGLIFPCHTFWLLIQFMRFSWQYTGVACRFLLQWITFCQNSPQWPIHLGWPYTAWLIASLQPLCQNKCYGSHETKRWCLNHVAVVQKVMKKLREVGMLV